ncbi:PGF-CTERM-anchored ABC transporter substrate-binding protein [Halosimplex pelagicum]|uniref:ABC transporter substrate-binding protein n=1 Tax=Halosimplex pelagicum TaxID=869886 RepID=A0A7D5ST69_9EURY|nr:PGF-CTERM-anchored ABC transporter substrate-binding protein [Halosimplex pelagicum]QLH80267.1 ABC transporter substrate-binding protein [Halosimplex pelagicum]
MRDATAVVGAALLVFAAVGAVPAAAGAGAATGASGAASASALADTHCTYPMTVTDATGTEVQIDENPDRLAALAPSAAQILWSIGADEETVAMPQDYYLSYLNGTEGKTDVVNDDGSIITEAVVGANPDLVLAPNVVPNETVQALRNSGLTVYKFEAASDLEDVSTKIELYGQLTGNYDRAGQVSARMQGQVQAIRDAVSGEDNPRVFFHLGGGWTAGEDTFVGQIVAAAGGDNIAAGEINTSNGYGSLSNEIVTQKDPEWIVQNGQYGSVPKTPTFNETTAVQEGNVVRVNRNFMTQNGPKNVEALKTIAQALHPEAYEAIDFSAVETPQPATCSTPTPTATATDSGGDATETAGMDGDGTVTATMMDADGTATPTAESEDGAASPAGTTTSGDGPGFGAATALVALLAGALVARRRR